MALFHYTLRDSSGAKRTGALEADSATDAANRLRATQAVILDLHPAKPSLRSPSPALFHPLHPSWLLPITSFDIEIGIWQLASMLRSGLSLLDALDTLALQARRPRAARLWTHLRTLIQRGERLSSAMETHAALFDPYILQLVRVGEESGEMDTVLSRAAEHLASRRDMRQLVTNALLYPLFTILMAVGVSAYLILSVIPKVAEFLQDGGATLPAMTQSMLTFAEWLQAHGLTLLALLLVGIAVFPVLYRLPAGRLALDALLLRLPPFSNVLRLSGTAVFSRGLGILIESGVSLLDSLHIVSSLLSNRCLSRHVEAAADHITRGGTLAEALSAPNAFLPMLGRMTAVAEKTGTLAETMNELAAFHERMLVLFIQRLSAIIEPVVIVLTGLIVGYVYISFFLALFSMAGVV